MTSKDKPARNDKRMDPKMLEILLGSVMIWQDHDGLHADVSAGEPRHDRVSVTLDLGAHVTLDADDVAALLAEIRHLRAGPRWIPVSDRLPAEGDPVWLWDGTRHLSYEGSLDCVSVNQGPVWNVQWQHTESVWGDITHWYPLPRDLDTHPADIGLEQLGDNLVAKDVAKARAEEREAIVAMLRLFIDEIIHTSHADGLGMGDQYSESIVRECIERIQRRDRPGDAATKIHAP